MLRKNNKKILHLQILFLGIIKENHCLVKYQLLKNQYSSIKLLKIMLMLIVLNKSKKLFPVILSGPQETQIQPKTLLLKRTKSSNSMISSVLQPQNLKKKLNLQTKTKCMISFSQQMKFKPKNQKK